MANEVEWRCPNCGRWSKAPGPQPFTAKARYQWWALDDQCLAWAGVTSQDPGVMKLRFPS